MARPFPKELREEVLAIALKREVPVTQLAKDFGVSAATIHGWVTAAEGGAASRKVGEADPLEVRELKKRNRILEQENEILRRAAAYFSRDVLPK
jgi:transposase